VKEYEIGVPLLIYCLTPEFKLMVEVNRRILRLVIFSPVNISVGNYIFLIKNPPVAGKKIRADEGTRTHTPYGTRS
jgi:hypothetical protein